MARSARILVALALSFAITLTAVADAQRQTRVKHGAPAGPGQYPWTVALLESARPGISAWNDQICGGTLVSDRVVVTAAHCVVDVQPDDLQVLAGATTLSRTDADDAHRHAVTRIAMHPQEDVEGERETRFDAAVLWLATPVPGAVPVEGLATASTAAAGGGVPLTVSGWGRIEDDTYPEELRFANVPSVSDAECGSPATWGDAFSTDDMMCALKPSPEVVDSCDGDSGGPLVTEPADPASNVGVRLVGIVSFGSEECDDPTLPGVYARVQAPAIHSWLSSAFDADPDNDPTPKPGDVTAAPVLSGVPQVGETLTCAGFAFDARGFPSTTAYEIRRRTSATGRVVVGADTYTLAATDVGFAFECRATGRITHAGGSATATSAATSPVAPGQTGGPAPSGPDLSAGPDPGAGGTAPPSTPEPHPPVPTPRPAPADTTLPSVGRVTRPCVHPRVCTFTKAAIDTGTGVATLHARLTTVSTRPCTRRGRRTRCAMTTNRTVRATRRPDGRFSIALRWLPRGRFTLTLTAVDGAQNRQRTATRERFTL